MDCHRMRRVRLELPKATGNRRCGMYGSMLGPIVLLALLMTARDAGAQGCTPPGTIAADRPGNLTAPLVLPTGYAQVEVGSSATRSAGDVSQSVAATLVRVGLSCWAEFRVASGGWVRMHAAAGEVSSGLADAWIGTKLRLARGAGARPHLGLLVGSLVPVGGSISHQRAEPEADLSAMWELPRGQSALLFAGGASRWAGTGRVFERLSGASWSVPLGSSAASFVEYSEVVRPHTRSRYATTGLQVFPTAAIQLDGFLVVPLPRPRSDLGVGVGLSRRW